MNNETNAMNTPQSDLIALARSALGVASDEELGARMDAKAPAISQWRMGRLPMPDHHVLRLAELAGVDAGLWLALVHSDKARRTDTREAWRAVAERIQSAHA